MRRNSADSALIGLLFLAATGHVRATQLFPEDPLGNSTGHFIYNEFMQLDAVSGNNLHFGVDVAGETGQAVMPGLSSGETCKILGEGTDFRILISRHLQDGNWACFDAVHIDPNTTFITGSWLAYDDTVGTLNEDRHLHAEILLSADNLVGNDDLRNPRKYGFRNAAWLDDTVVPVVDSLVIHYGPPDVLQIWVHDTNDGNTSYYNGIYKLLLKVDDRVVDSLQLAKYATKAGVYPPTPTEYYYDTSTYPIGYNNPNVLQYKLVAPYRGEIWRVAWWDGAGNHQESGPIKITAMSAGGMAGNFQDGKAYLTWSVRTAEDLDHFDVYESANEGQGYERINSEPILVVAGRTDYGFVAELPAGWDRIWYRVIARDVWGTQHLVAQQQFEIPAPLMTGVRVCPNPSGSEFHLELQVARASFGAAEVFTASGRKIRTIHKGSFNRGKLDYAWNGLDDRGNAVPPGVYLLRVEIGEMPASTPRRFVRKLTVVR